MSTGPRTLDSAPLLVERLLEWFDSEARELPWRSAPTPYAVWISEVMLQQTQVQTVIPYFERWMASFPDVSTLAQAELDEVLKSWAGLGYYRRARNIQRAARQIVAEHGGTLPSSYDALLDLPGIGAYTAGAIASIAFGEAQPAVDGNVLRVHGRLLEVDPARSRARRETAARAWVRGVIPPHRPGDFNQALMELGALLCRPTQPLCADCPVEPQCPFPSNDVLASSPSRRPPRHRVIEAAVALFDPDGRLLLGRRTENGLLGGLWELPATEVSRVPGRARVGERAPDEWVDAEVLEKLGRYVTQELKLECELGHELVRIDHTFTHIDYTVLISTAFEVDPSGAEAPLDRYTRSGAFSADELEELGLSSLARKALDKLPAPPPQQDR